MHVEQPEELEGVENPPEALGRDSVLSLQTDHQETTRRPGQRAIACSCILGLRGADLQRNGLGTSVPHQLVVPLNGEDRVGDDRVGSGGAVVGMAADGRRATRAENRSHPDTLCNQPKTLSRCGRATWGIGHMGPHLEVGAMDVRQRVGLSEVLAGTVLQQTVCASK